MLKQRWCRSLAIAMAVVLPCVGCGDFGTSVSPSFTVHLPDSQHQVSRLGPPGKRVGIWGTRISIVRPDPFESFGTVTASTYSAWSKWLVIKVLEPVDSAVPRYYFIDPITESVKGPWSPKARTHLERFLPDGRFVAYDRKSPVPRTGLSKDAFIVDPATQRESHFAFKVNDAWSEWISADGRRIAQVSGGADTELQVTVLDIENQSVPEIMQFPERMGVWNDGKERSACCYLCALSTDGATLALAGAMSAEPGKIEFWNVSSGKLHRVVTLPDDYTADPAAVSQIAFSPDGRFLAVTMRRPVSDSSRHLLINLETNAVDSAFNAWEGTVPTGVRYRGALKKDVCLNQHSVLMLQHRTLNEKEDFENWQLQVTDMNGQILRSWKELPDAVARRIDGRLDAKIVPETTCVAVLNDNSEVVTVYNWQTDRFARIGATHPKHQSADFYGVTPGHVHLVFREDNGDVVVKCWAMKDVPWSTPK